MAKLTLDSTIGEALEHKMAVDLVEKIKPGITKNPVINMVKKFPLKKIVKFDQVGISEEELVKYLAEINEAEGNE